MWGCLVREIVGSVEVKPEVDSGEPPIMGGVRGETPTGEHLGSSMGPLVVREAQDVIVEEGGKWSVYSEGAPRRRLGGPYASRELAELRLRQVERFKREGERDAYQPPPGPGSAAGNHPAPVTKSAPAAPDPRTPPPPIGARADSRSRARRRLPRQIPPTRLEEDYAGKLVKIVGRARAAYAGLLRELPALLASKKTDHLDSGEGARVKRLVAAASEHASKSITRGEVEDIARKHAAKLSIYQKAQLSRQVRAALGTEPTFKDRGLADAIEQFTHENAALVTRIPTRLHGDLETMVQRAVSSAQPHPALADQIEARFGVAERHARLIARDQTLKLHAKLNHARQRELGVERFVWRTVGDDRVRDEHEELDGEEFDYDDPPDEGLPGDEICCRCSSEPVFSDEDDDD